MLAPLWEEMLHSFRDAPGVIDIRNAGVLGAIQLESGDVVGVRGRAMFEKLWDLGLSVRPVGDSFAMSPPLTMTPADVDQIGELLRKGFA